MKAHYSPTGANRLQAGFSLIELMVAMVVGLIIMLAVLSLFLNVSRTNDEMAKTNALIENGRYALDIIRDDLMHAGFWDGYVPAYSDLTEEGIPTDEPKATDPLPDPCLAYASWTNAYKSLLLAIPVQVYGYSNPSAVCSAITADREADTDMLVVRYADTCVVGAVGCSVQADSVRFQASRCSEDAAAYKLAKSSFDLHTRSSSVAGSTCDVGSNYADVRQLRSAIYYVRSWSSVAGDNIPVLMRSTFSVDSHLAAEPVVEGIEAFRIEVGIDNTGETGQPVNYDAAVDWVDDDNKVDPVNRGDGVADVYREACPAAPGVADPNANPGSHCNSQDMRDAVVARIYVLARSLQEAKDHVDNREYRLGSVSVGPFDDKYKRHVFSTTVRLTNVSTRRETP